MAVGEQQTKAYRGNTSAEVLAEIKKELGSEAVILTTRSIRTTRGGSVVEVIAAPEGYRAAPAVSASQSTLAKLQAVLVSNGVAKESATRIIDTYRRSTTEVDTLDKRVLRTCIAALVRIRHTREPERRLLALLGPTGVGKTTTAAKLATRDRLAGRQVGLITIDTHRIGGVEQLARYAALIKAPLCTANTPQELRSALRKFRDYERIYVDTAGTGFNAPERIEELGHILGGSELERMLLLPASANERDLKKTAAAFSTLEPGSVSVTKADETSYFGPCFNVLHELRLPLELFGTGQRVPDDLERASTATLLHLLTIVTH